MSSEVRHRRGRGGRVAILAAFLALAGMPVEPAEAIVFHARDEALRLAFPDADRVEPRDFFLTTAQREAIEKHARAALESDLLTVYVGHHDGGVTGYAILDTHVVRTLPETFMIVLTPDGSVRATHVLAFYEPTDYMPGDRWLEQFVGKSGEDELRLGRGIDGITGSTLSARAVADAVRRALAVYDVLLETR